MKGNHGFTLLELLVVIGIVGILMALSAPAVIEWRRDSQFKEAAQLAASMLRQAKGQAINVNQRVRVDFNLVTKNVAITVVGATDPNYSGTIPGNIVLKSGKLCDSTSNPFSLTFNPNGSSGSGYLCILDGATQKYRIGVASATTGRILFQKSAGVNVWE